MMTGSELLRALGLTMVHSLWEGAIITALILLVAGIIPKTSARPRYFVMLTGLLLLLAAFCTTFLLLYRSHLAYGLTGRNGFSELYSSAYLMENSSWSFIENFTDWFITLLEPYYPFLALCWITGFIITGIQTTGGFLLTRNMMLKDTEFADVTLRLGFDRLKQMLRITQPVILRVTQRMVSPMVIGFLKPAIVLPIAAVSGLSASQLEAVIIHELAHIRRYDHLIILLQAFARQVLFFHRNVVPEPRN
ncbi:MAG: M56 family metallopeptidase [Candidatus Moduliflexus flocculans]|nr:M56 family metallopeptidase [Candidatus Moduliflexus flocculans]